MDVPLLADIGPEVSDVTDTLQSVAEAYPPRSREHRTLAFAASALLFLHATGQLRAFDEYVAKLDQPLSEEERIALNSMGLIDEDDTGL